MSATPVDSAKIFPVLGCLIGEGGPWQISLRHAFYSKHSQGHFPKYLIMQQQALQDTQSIVHMRSMGLQMVPKTHFREASLLLGQFHLWCLPSFYAHKSTQVYQTNSAAILKDKQPLGLCPHSTSRQDTGHSCGPADSGDPSQGNRSSSRTWQRSFFY